MLGVCMMICTRETPPRCTLLMISPILREC